MGRRVIAAARGARRVGATLRYEMNRGVATAVCVLGIGSTSGRRCAETGVPVERRAAARCNGPQRTRESRRATPTAWELRMGTSGTTGIKTLNLVKGKE